MNIPDTISVNSTSNIRYLLWIELTLPRCLRGKSKVWQPSSPVSWSKTEKCDNQYYCQNLYCKMSKMFQISLQTLHSSFWRKWGWGGWEGGCGLVFKGPHQHLWIYNFILCLIETAGLSSMDFPGGFGKPLWRGWLGWLRPISKWNTNTLEVNASSELCIYYDEVSLYDCQVFFFSGSLYLYRKRLWDFCPSQWYIYSNRTSNRLAVGIPLKIWNKE